MINDLLKSIIDQDRARIVVCDLTDTIVYLNPSAAEHYQKKGVGLLGHSIMDCHNENSCEMIRQIVGWFKQSKDNNIQFTYHNPKENKDIYMVALRDVAGELIGYYEKHEYRTLETAKPYSDPTSAWTASALDKLIFSKYMGPAAIFVYDRQTVKLIRVNNKYQHEFGSYMSANEIMKHSPLDVMGSSNSLLYRATMERAIRSGYEEECETWRDVSSTCCGDNKMCIRSSVQVIEKQPNNKYLMFALIRNITNEKKSYDELLHSERRFRAASEQANVYAWEYDVATKEMRPCFRCMRDLGLPALLQNYPEPAIEMGIFPSDYADMYRYWHKLITAGKTDLEAIMPLTTGRVPFIVRYTTEFDDDGRPIKAYGSATLVVGDDFKLTDPKKWMSEH